MRLQLHRFLLLGMATTGAIGAALSPSVVWPGTVGAAPPAAPPRTAAPPTARAASPAGPRGGSERRRSFTPLSPQQAAASHREFYFTRAIYSSGGRGFVGRGRRSWAVDFPKADRQFMTVLTRLIDIDASPDENPIRLDDPDIRRFPFLYALEVGGMNLTEAEVEGLRSYLEAGGFLVIDDSWGPYEWAVFEREISRVLPGRPIYEIPLTHPLFNNVYDMDSVIQVPNIRNGRNHGLYGTPTWECRRGCETPHVFGIDDDRGRLMVLINWNTDLGDAWEWAENEWYPTKFSHYAFEMGINMIVYAMSH